ncbi:alpha/beta hydrolase-fold protein [Curtobacterium pusillum]|uniref:alpha/beta hydrolase-fold protein n=1 Tax=Curtobacterium pusillum TaxID=69373 RepID=UPI0037FE6100
MTLRDRLSALHGADATALEAFWAAVPPGDPVVERTDRPGSVRVTFLRRDHGARAVHCGLARVTDRSHWRSGLMTRVPDTDVWWLELVLPSDLRTGYAFRAFDAEAPADEHFGGRPWDPVGPRPSATVELALPDAPLPDLATRHRPHVDVTTPETPWGTAWTTSPAAARTLLVLADGRTWIERLHLPAVLAAFVEEPVAIAALDSETRDERLARLGGDTGYAEFLADTFLPWARTTTGVDADRERTWFAGQSLGGLTALLLAARRSAAFGTVVAQSPSVWWHPAGGRTPADMPPVDATPWIHEQLAPSPGTSTRVLLHAGTLEGTTPHHVDTAAGRLRALGHDATATPFTGGHEPLCWRVALVDALATGRTPMRGGVASAT